MAKYRKMLALTIPSIDAMMELLSTQSKTTIAVENEPNPAKLNWNC